MPQRRSEDIQHIRNFHRHYTNLINFITKDFPQKEISLAELRVLHEIKYSPGATSKEISRHLSMDSGYLSRLIAKLEKKSCLVKCTSAEDKRLHHIKLTDDGEKKLREAAAIFEEKVVEITGAMPQAQRIQLFQNITALDTILSESNLF